LENSVSISGPLSFYVHYRAARVVFAKSNLSIAAYCFFFGIPALTFALMLTTGRDVTQTLRGIPIWLCLLSVPLFVIAFLPLCQVLNVWQARRRNAALQGTLMWTVSAEGFASHSSAFDGMLRWPAIHRVVETREFFLFYIAATSATFIPKAYATSPVELDNVRAIIRESFGDKAKLQTR
jgi:hypothetical protein